MILEANCKINLGLDIIRKRPDGYHDIATVMLPVPGLCDTIVLEHASALGAEFVNEGAEVDCPPEKNLCVKAYNLLAGRYPLGGVRITLRKRVPFGAGLGGGSADAAFTLRGLCSLFGLPCGDSELIGLAARLGSDVPFFIRNTPQLCEGRGEIMTPVSLPQLEGMYLVVVKPATAVSTAEAYGGVTPCEPVRPLMERLSGESASWRREVANGFEPHIFAAHPELASIKERLYSLGAVYAAMSGSGSAIFGLFGGVPPRELPFGGFVHVERLSGCR